MLKSIMDDRRILRHNLQALFLVDAVAKRDFATNGSAMLYLAVQDRADPLTA